jgi:hypothetical protein
VVWSVFVSGGKDVMSGAYIEPRASRSRINACSYSLALFQLS